MSNRTVWVAIAALVAGAIVLTGVARDLFSGCRSGLVVAAEPTAPTAKARTALEELVEKIAPLEERYLGEVASRESGPSQPYARGLDPDWGDIKRSSVSAAKMFWRVPRAVSLENTLRNKDLNPTDHWIAPAFREQLGALIREFQAHFEQLTQVRGTIRHEQLRRLADAGGLIPLSQVASRLPEEERATLRVRAEKIAESDNQRSAADVYESLLKMACKRSIDADGAITNDRGDVFLAPRHSITALDAVTEYYSYARLTFLASVILWFQNHAGLGEPQALEILREFEQLSHSSGLLSETQAGANWCAGWRRRGPGVLAAGVGERETNRVFA